ncbi:MAG TPA: gamma-glutamylcyclotransferase [Poseidonia sp.]|nr:gamma-glutamylcyclotransferase [Poseidonia sp.]
MAVKQLYFSYGSNMDQDDWAAWCRGKGLDPSGLVELGPAWLPDYTLKFHYYSSRRKGGAADVVPSVRGSIVPGIMFEVNEDTLATLDLKEGAPNSYQRTHVTIIDDNGSLRQAITYTVLKSRYSGGYERPHRDYIHLIRHNLLRHKLPIENLNSAIENNNNIPFLDHVFVYGTLRQGECRSASMSKLAKESISHATVLGTLHNHGAYPGLIPEGNTVVVGELHRCQNITDALAVLDGIEGFHSYDEGENLYNRTVKKVTIQGKEQWAWTYLTNLPTSEQSIITSGDWKSL